MVSASTKQTLIISASAIVGLTTVSALAYLLIQDDRRAKHQRKIRSVQKSLSHKLSKVEAAVQSLVEGDIRMALVRTKTLRTYPIYPGDNHIQLPSGLINEQDKNNLGEEIEETSDELIRERAQGYAEDSQKVRQAYKRLDFLINSVNEQLLRLLESLDAISPRELTDLGDGSGGIPSANGLEVAAFEKVKKRKRADIAKIQRLMVQLDKIGASFKDRLSAVEEYEKKAAEEAEASKEAAAKEAAAAAKEEEAKKKKAEEDKEKENEKEHHHANGHAEHDLVKEGLSYAQVTKMHSTMGEHEHDENEVLAPTEDLEKMKAGKTFVDAVVSHEVEEQSTESSSSSSELEASVDNTIVESVSFADVVASGQVEEQSTESLSSSESEAPVEKTLVDEVSVAIAEVAAAH